MSTPKQHLGWIQFFPKGPLLGLLEASTKKGSRLYYWSPRASRLIPISKSEATQRLVGLGSIQ